MPEVFKMLEHRKPAPLSFPEHGRERFSIKHFLYGFVIGGTIAFALSSMGVITFGLDGGTPLVHKILLISSAMAGCAVGLRTAWQKPQIEISTN